MRSKNSDDPFFCFDNIEMVEQEKLNLTAENNENKDDEDKENDAVF